jgi:hypothetical protein
VAWGLCCVLRRAVSCAVLHRAVSSYAVSCAARCAGICVHTMLTTTTPTIAPHPVHTRANSTWTCPSS